MTPKQLQKICTLVQNKASGSFQYLERTLCGRSRTPFAGICRGFRIGVQSKRDLTTSRCPFLRRTTPNDFAAALLGARLASLPGLAFRNAPVAKRVDAEQGRQFAWRF